MVIDRIRNGGGSMPAFEGMLSEEEIQQVAEYANSVIAPMQ